MKRSLIILNVLLAVILCYKGYSMLHEIYRTGAEKYHLPDFTFTALKRPPLELRQNYRNIFDVQSSGSTGSPTTGAGDPLSQLLRTAKTFQVQGILISDTATYAMLSRKGEGTGNQAAEWTKVRVGDKVEDFSVVAIKPGVVILANDSAGEIVLRIFKEPEARIKPAEPGSR
jgi:hypothetical protein